MLDRRPAISAMATRLKPAGRAAPLGIDDAAAYLMQAGLIGASAVIDGDLAVKPVTRRNRNLTVSRADGPGYLLKQPEDPVAARTLQREGGFYRLCRRDPAASELLEHMPGYLFFDEARSILGIELIEPAEPLWSYFGAFAADELPVVPAAQLGLCLGRLHRAFRSRLDQPELEWLGGEPPWIMQVHEPGLDFLATVTTGNHKLLQIIQSQPGLSARLDRLRPLWRRETVIHGDVKSDNILLSRTAAPAGEGAAPQADRLRLVDWELVQGGDPAWDIAGVLQDFVMLWVMSMPAAADLPSMVAQARYPLERLRPLIAKFWDCYRDAAAPSPSDRGQLFVRAARYSAARLVQSAFEMGTGFSHGLPQPAVLLLQIGQHLLDDPAAGQVQLYGIRHEL
jgi:hypothetical protein